MHSPRRSFAAATIIAGLALAACAARQPKNVTGGATAGPAQNTPGAWCEQYCAKLAECYGSMPNDQPDKPPAQVQADCRTQLGNCQATQTTDSICCSAQVECANFAGCVYSAKNQPASCG